MSDWAGIKKAINSNLDVPLNELIEDKSKISEPLFLKHSKCSNNDGTIFSIENENGGFINAVAFPQFNFTGENQAFEYKLIIDDKEAFSLKITHTSTFSSTTSASIIKIANINSMYISNGYMYPWFGDSYSLYDGFEPNKTMNEVGKKLEISTDGYSEAFNYPMTNMLRFRKSFSIVVKRSNLTTGIRSNRYGSVSYCLFD